MAVLVVEDEEKIAAFIRRGLKEDGYEVEIAGDGETALALAGARDFDVMVLDLMLPDIDGIAVCKRLRASGVEMPILMLTARDEVSDKVLGLDAGANDYLTKPFAFDEFLARIRALTRKRSALRAGQLRIADLTLDRTTHKVTRAGIDIELSNKEYTLLEYLMRNAGQTLTRNMISQQVWNIDYDTYTNVIDVYIKYLRKKVDEPFGQRLIKTIRGRGYAIDGNEG